jgi:hypothetical protein
MKLQNIMNQDSTFKHVYKKIKGMNTDSEKTDSQFFRNEVTNALKQIKERTKNENK